MFCNEQSFIHKPFVYMLSNKVTVKMKLELNEQKCTS